LHLAPFFVLLPLWQGTPWRDSVLLRIDNPDKGTIRSSGSYAPFTEPDFLLCYARLVCLFKCEFQGEIEPCALIQWYDSYLDHDAKQRVHRKGGDIYARRAMPLFPCMQLQGTFDVVSLEGTVELPVWLVQDFDEASRYWHIKHGPQWE
jgi:hypothetical protein